jgi:hypothetical protein
MVQPQSIPFPAEQNLPTEKGASDDGGRAALGGFLVLLTLFGLFGLVRRSMKGGHASHRASPVKAPALTQPAAAKAIQSASRPPAGPVLPATRTSIVVGGVKIEAHAAGRAPSKASTLGKTKAVWHPPGTPVSVGGTIVPDGMVYIGQSTSAWGGQDASFIDPTLPIARTSAAAAPLGYWPSYKGLKPECRRLYIEWLASGKRTPDTDVGYVFIYFYGLERRLLVDTPPAEEVRALIAEIRRLRDIYATNNSFNAYSSCLLEAAVFLQEEGSSNNAFCPDLAADLGEMPLRLKVAVAREIVAGRPLAFELAAAALLGLRDFTSQHRHALEAGRTAFLAVLRTRFATTFPGGLTMRNRKDSHLELSYRGASAGLVVDLAARARLKELPDPGTLTWTKLINLGTAVAEEVAPYAKALAYHPARANALYGIVACPPELRGQIARDARNWLDALPSPASVRFGELAGYAIGTTTAKWTVRHRRQISDALSMVGYAMEPDAEDGAEHLEDSTVVQVFRYPSEARSRAMEIASAAAMLVTAIASVGGPGRAAEHWLSVVPLRLSLSADQMTRLKARLAWLGSRDVSVGQARRALKDATPDEKDFCAWSATVAAGAAGTVGKPQVAMLEAIYDALGVPKTGLYAGLHAGIGAATIAADEPVLVSDEVSELLHPITRAPVSEPEPASLAMDRLARIRAETDRVSAMLADIFVEEEPQPLAAAPSGGGVFAGLDAGHAAFLTHLLSRDQWPRAAIDEAAVRAGLMPGGALETINEWAFDHHGDALIEDGEPVVINRSMLGITSDAVAAE